MNSWRQETEQERTVFFLISIVILHRVTKDLQSLCLKEVKEFIAWKMIKTGDRTIKN
jgi:hypothetical protein